MKKLFSLLVALSVVLSTAVVIPVSVSANTADNPDFAIVYASKTILHIGEKRAISFQVYNPKMNAAKTEIIDSKGKLVKLMGTTEYYFGFYAWDGKDSKKKYVSDGNYRIKLTVSSKSKFLMFKVKKNILANDIEAATHGFVNMYGCSIKIPSSWDVYSSYSDYSTSSQGKYFNLYSPYKKGKTQTVISFKYRNFTSSDFSDAFILQESIKSSDFSATSEFAGKVLGEFKTNIGGRSNTVKTYEYNSKYLQSLYDLTNYLATIKDYFSVNNKIVFDIKISCKKGDNSSQADVSEILKSLKFTTIDAKWFDEFGSAEITSSGKVVCSPFTFTLPTGYYSEMAVTSSIDKGCFVTKGNKVFADKRFRAQIGSVSQTSYSFDTYASMIKDSFRGLPGVIPNSEDVTIDGVSMKKISASYINERYKWADISEVYIFQRDSTFYMVYFTIKAEKNIFDMTTINKMIADKDALMASIKIAK